MYFCVNEVQLHLLCKLNSIGWNAPLVVLLVVMYASVRFPPLSKLFDRVRIIIVVSMSERVVYSFGKNEWRRLMGVYVCDRCSFDMDECVV